MRSGTGTWRALVLWVGAQVNHFLAWYPDLHRSPLQANAGLPPCRAQFFLPAQIPSPDSRCHSTWMSQLLSGLGGPRSQPGQSLGVVPDGTREGHVSWAQMDPWRKRISLLWRPRALRIMKAWSCLFCDYREKGCFRMKSTNERTVLRDGMTASCERHLSPEFR